MLNAFRVQISVLVTYTVSAVLAVVLWLPFLWQGAQSADTLGWKIPATYGAPLGLILGAMLSTDAKPKSIDSGRAWICLAFVIVWNLVVLGTLLYAQKNYVLLSDLAEAMDKVTGAATFLTAAVLAFLFGSTK